MSYESICKIKKFDEKDHLFDNLPWCGTLLGHVLSTHDLFVSNGYNDFLKLKKSSARKKLFLYSNLIQRGVYAFSSFVHCLMLIGQDQLAYIISPAETRNAWFNSKKCKQNVMCKSVLCQVKEECVIVFVYVNVNNWSSFCIH